jgi:hypothetical protein
MRIRVERMGGITLIPALCAKVTYPTFSSLTGRDVTRGERV